MAEKPTTLHVKVISPDAILFDGKCDLLIAPGRVDTLGIFPGHAPLYAELIRGDIVLQGASDSTFALESGILRLRDTEAIILIIPPEKENK